MEGSPAVLAAVSLVAALIPAALGAYSWTRRTSPGTRTLALLLFFLSLWGLLWSLEFFVPGSAILYSLEQIAAVALAPLWFVFTIQHTGRGSWLTWPRLMVVVAVPLLTLVLLLLDGSMESGAWFWVDAAYRVSLVSLGSAFLLQQVFGGQSLYALQSSCLLGGFLAPWGVGVAQLFDGDPGPLAVSLALLTTGILFVWGIYRWRLLDVAPISPEAMIHDMGAGVLVLDLRNRVTDLNAAAERILGCKAQAVVGEDFRKVISGSGVAPLEGDRGSALLRNYEKDGEAREEIILGKDDAARYYDLTLSELRGRRERIGHLMVLYEVTERRTAAEQLGYRARHDSLTSLPNRSFFHERLSQEISRSRRRRSSLALFFLDLDRFKEVNDTLGHETGDELLKEVAGRLQSTLREYDTAARIAGDEFTAILADLDEPQDAIPVAERVLRALSEPMNIAGHELRVTTSLGVSFYPADGATPEELIKSADAAMYAAKSRGKNRYEIYTDNELAHGAKGQGLEEEIRRAVTKDELVLYYQPTMRVDNGRVAGFEALLRWEHPERGLISPDDFLPIALDTNLIFQIEEWVLHEACQQMRYWQEGDPDGPSLRMNVNLSSRYLEHPNLVGAVSRILRETALPPQSLALDLGESDLTDSPSSIETLQALKDLGVGLAVDNFGAGYSSLSDLRRFPLDTLKIDRTIISELHGASEVRTVLSAVVSLGHALGLTVSATGVETAQQLMHLRKMGCDTAQGHYFTESLSKRAASSFLASVNIY